MIPRFLVDDTAEIGDARVFVAHTIAPRFFGEVVDDGEEGLGAVEIDLGEGQVLTVREWIDRAPYPGWPGWGELRDAAASAIRIHDDMRGAP